MYLISIMSHYISNNWVELTYHIHNPLFHFIISQPLLYLTPPDSLRTPIMGFIINALWSNTIGQGDFLRPFTISAQFTLNHTKAEKSCHSPQQELTELVKLILRQATACKKKKKEKERKRQGCKNSVLLGECVHNLYSSLTVLYLLFICCSCQLCSGEMGNKWQG